MIFYEIRMQSHVISAFKIQVALVENKDTVRAEELIF
jgi:hypothetical protein